MLKRTCFMAVIDGVFCLRMGAVHRPSWHFSCFTFNQRYNLQRKNENHKSLGGP